MQLKSLSLALVLGLVSLVSFASNPARAEQAPQLLAVKFHADWCPTCRRMGTVFEDLDARFEGRPVEFVLLDRTDAATTRAAEAKVAELGLGEVWAQNPGTGYILLIDADSREVVDELTARLDLEQMARKLEERLEAASS